MTASERAASNIQAGLCRCGRARDGARRSCAACRANYNAGQARYRAKLHARWQPLGCCIECGTPTDRNPRTGKAYRTCFTHRLRRARWKHDSRVRSAPERIRLRRAYGRTAETRVVELLTQPRTVTEIVGAGVSHAVAVRALRTLLDLGMVQRLQVRRAATGRPAVVFSKVQPGGVAA